MTTVHLIIAEKPSVARDIARVFKVKTKREGCFEGERVLVTWCLGHMVQLAQPERYDAQWKRWTRQALPMIPPRFELDAIASSRDQLQVVRRLLHDPRVEVVVNACDAGREGELIFRYVYELAQATKPVKRAWLASMTDEAIRAAFKQLQDGRRYDALADAARSRSEADWLVGLNATRAMTLQCRAAGADELMSVGRVQTPTLAMLVQREQEIESFVPEDYWQVVATFDASPQAEGLPSTYEGLWTRDKRDRLPSAQEAEAILEQVEGEQAEVVEATHKDVRERPPLLFDLTSLQRAANQRYGYSAQATLDAAQSLYEKFKLLTYPRTDSNHLTEDMRQSLLACVQAVNVGPFAPFAQPLLDAAPLPTSKRIINDEEVGDHHAIIPTDRSPDLERLPEAERRVYELVVRRFLAAFYPDAIFATTVITTRVKAHDFLTRGKLRVEAGWQLVEPPMAEQRASSASPSSRAAGKAQVKGQAKGQAKGQDAKPEEPTLLPTVLVGQALPVVDARVHKSQTSPPRRYSESALLGAMERAGQSLDDAALRRVMKESGLGTPATRAAMIETLLKRDYIRRDRKNLVPTPKGRALIEAIPFEPLKSAQLTGQWEAKLNSIAAAKLARADFMAEVNALTRELTDTILAKSLSLDASLTQPKRDPDASPLGPCPLCTSPVTEGHMAYSCAQGRACSFVIFKTIAGRKISPTLVKLLLAGKTSQRLKGFKSQKTKKTFEAALRLDAQGKVELVFEPAPDAARSQTSSTAPAPAQGRDPLMRALTPSAPAKTKDKAQDTIKAPSKTSPARRAPRAPAPEALPAAITSLTCPRCKQGAILVGKRAWGCSRWREGCRFVLPFEHEGIWLDEPQAIRLLAQGQLEVEGVGALRFDPTSAAPLTLMSAP